MEVRVIFRGLTQRHWNELYWRMRRRHDLRGVRRRGARGRKDLRNLLVFEYLAPGELYLRPDLRKPRCAAGRDVKNGVKIRQQETYQVVEVHQRDSQDQWPLGRLDDQRLWTRLLGI